MAHLVNGRFRTALCRHFMTTGNCPYGDACLFAHGPSQLVADVDIAWSRLLQLNGQTEETWLEVWTRSGLGVRGKFNSVDNNDASLRLRSCLLTHHSGVSGDELKIAYASIMKIIIVSHRPAPPPFATAIRQQQQQQRQVCPAPPIAAAAPVHRSPFQLNIGLVRQVEETPSLVTENGDLDFSFLNKIYAEIDSSSDSD